MFARSSTRPAWLLLIGSFLAFGPSAHAATFAAGQIKLTPAHCNALKQVDLSVIQDAPTQVTELKVIGGTSDNGAYCRISGYVWPQIGFELHVPLNDWNGRLLFLGCGGNCGETAWIFLCPAGKNYACITSDMGHRSTALQGLWAYNNLQARYDFTSRAVHVVTLAGKAIVENLYGMAPIKSLFQGCSNGGHEGLIEAQSFPWDFDGIIAGAPAVRYSNVFVGFVWAVRALSDSKGDSLLLPGELHLIHRAALAKCDRDDGVADGVIGNPLACKFDPAELACRAGQTSDCLTAAQVDAVRKVYSGPVSSSGSKIFYGVLPGSELNWVDGPDRDPYIRTVASAPRDGYELMSDDATEMFRYMASVPGAGPGWKLGDFDIDRDYKRIGIADSPYGGENPDLRRFKNAGGRLLMYQGLTDIEVTPADAVDYYQTVERVIGDRTSTQDFFRLFLIPGMDHCTGGAGAFAVDYLSHLEKWVETGHGPDELIGAHVDDVYLTGLHGPDNLWGSALSLALPLDESIPVTFTRPIYPYPLTAKYVGKGDPTSAASFRAIRPE